MTDVSLGCLADAFLLCQRELCLPSGFYSLLEAQFMFSRGRLNVMRLRRLPFQYPASYHWRL